MRVELLYDEIISLNFDRRKINHDNIKALIHDSWTQLVEVQIQSVANCSRSQILIFSKKCILKSSLK